MSGTGANLPVNIRVTGTQEAEAAFNRVGTAAGTSMQRVQQSTQQASGGARDFGHVVGQAGFQVQDFATQVQMGQNAVSAFGVQFAQFAGLFGTGGAVAGAVVVAGTLAANMLSIGENAAEAERRIQVAFDAIKADSEGVRDVIKEIGDLYKTAADRAQDLARAQALVLSQNVDLRLSNSIQMQDAAATRIPQLEAEIARMELQARQASGNARRGAGALGAPVDETTDITSRLFVARSQLNGLRSEMDLQDRRIAQLNDARTALGRRGSDSGLGEFGPAAPASIETTRAALDREFVLRREHSARLDSINVALAQGNTTAAEATNLRAMAERKLTEDLKALADRQGGATQALREYVTLQRDAGTGLLLGSESDARAAREIAAQLRVTQQERTRAEAETRRDQERTLREQERQNQQVTDSIVRYGADRFADMFAENGRGWAGMLDTFRSTFRSLMARIAAEAIIRPIIAPIVQGLGLGQMGGSGGGLNLSGIFGGGKLAQPVSQGGGLTDSGSSFGTLRTAYNGMTSPGGLGSMFPGGMGFSTGFGAADGLLNTSLIAPSGLDAATNSALGAMGGQFGPATPGALMGAGAAPGLTIGSALGPLAAIGGGAYGVYSGLQRGGIGGYTGAAGGAVSAATGIGMLGAAAGLLPALGVLGPIGLAAGAVLAIAGALLPGANPSGMGQLARTNLGTNERTYEGLGGSRFSQANRDAASGAVDNIAQLARTLGDQLGGARIGGNVAVGTTNGTIYLEVGGQRGQFANTEEGSKQLAAAAAEMVLQEFRSQGAATGDYASILGASGSLNALSSNLQWYENTYKTLLKAKEPVSAFEQAVNQLSAQFEPAIAKARELGLSVDAMTASREREIQKLRDARDQQLYRFDAGIDIRQARLRGDLTGAEGLSFDIAATQQVEQARAELESLGVTAEESGARILRLEQTLAAERVQIIEEAGRAQTQAAQASALAQTQAAQASALAQTQAAQSVLDWLNAQALGASSSLSPTARLAEAERQFNAASASGDMRALTSAADALLINSRDVFGGATESFAQREAFVRSTVAQRGLQSSAGGSAEVVGALSQMVAVFQSELANLGAKFDALTAETRRGNNQGLAA